MEKFIETYPAPPVLEDFADDGVNPVGSNPSTPEKTSFPAAAPLRFKSGTSLETAESIHRYARIFGGDSVKLIEDEAGLGLVLMEARDCKLMLDQFSDYLS